MTAPVRQSSLGRRTPRWVASLVAVLIVVGGLAAPHPPAYAEDDLGRQYTVWAERCDHTTRALWMLGNDFLFLSASLTLFTMPFLGVITTGPIIAAFAAFQFVRCVGPDSVRISTAADLIVRLEAIAEDTVDEAVVQQLASLSVGIGTLIDDRAALFEAWQRGELSAEDQRSLASFVEHLAIKANVAFATAANSANWPTLGILLALGAQQMSLYGLSAALTNPGPVRDARLALSRRVPDDTLAALRAQEDRFRSLLRQTAAGPERAHLMSRIPASYLAEKATFGYHAAFGGESSRAFLLSNNRPYLRPGEPQQDTCVGVDGGAGAVLGATLALAWCNPDTRNPGAAAQVWEFVPGTPILRHVRSGLCVAGPTEPAAVGGQKPVRLTSCPEPEDYLATTGANRFDWGIHPAGHLVHLATGRCLDPDGLADTAGAVLSAGVCAFDRPSRPGGLDAPDGMRPTDPQNDQLWHLVRPAKTVVRVVAAGDSAVRVRSVPAGIDCGAGGGSGCEATFDLGTQVHLEAVLAGVPAGVARLHGLPGVQGCVPLDGSSCAFDVGLPGAPDPTYRGQVVTVATDRLRSVAVRAAPHGSVTVAPDAEVDGGCGDGVCTHWFERDTEVTLTASADDGFLFSGWHGGCAGQGSVCTVAVAGADQETRPTYAPAGVVRVVKSGSGAGSVTATGADIDCGSVCETPVPVGSEVVLRATAAPGHTFGGWTGPCTGSGVCVVTVAALTEVGAEFVAPVVRPRLRIRTVRRQVPAGGVARFLISVRAEGVVPTGRLTVRVAGVRRAVAVQAATTLVRLRIPRTTRPGPKRVVVNYGDDPRLTDARATARLVVRRAAGRVRK